MTDLDQAMRARLRQMIDGYQISQAISVMAELRIADALAAGSRSTAEIARETGVDVWALTRLLHALAAVELVAHDGGDMFALSPMGQYLTSDAASSLRHMAIHAGQPYMWAAWSQLLYSVQTGQSAFPHVHGMGVWDYRAQHEKAGRVFADAMAASDDVAASLVRAYDFSSARVVVDIGGGYGVLLTEILANNPWLRGVLLEQALVTDDARTVLDEAGIGERCAVIAGDFMKSIPDGGDVYILKGVLHDWSDEQSMTILSNCRRRMAPAAKLLVIEQLADVNASAFTRFMDLHMLVIHGGAERTRADFERLLTQTGFFLVRTLSTGSGLNIIEASPFR